MNVSTRTAGAFTILASAIALMMVLPGFLASSVQMSWLLKQSNHVIGADASSSYPIARCYPTEPPRPSPSPSPSPTPKFQLV